MMKKLIIMPAGAHPFHPGHLALYNAAKQAFPDGEVYVAATNDTTTRPFPFAIKEKLAKLAGVEAGHFVEVKSPFRANEIVEKYNPEDTILIFVRSEKDRQSQPMPGGNKKDGSPSYLQPYSKKLEPLTKHAYMAYLPTIKFAGGFTSASQIRAKWPKLDDSAKHKLVNQLYPKTQGNDKLTLVTIKMLDKAIGSALDENKIFYKKLHTQAELIEHAKKFSAALKFDNVPVSAYNRFYTVCSTAFAHVRQPLNENKIVSAGQNFIKTLKSQDQFDKLNVQIGSEVAIINAQLQGDQIELWGFLTPKTITKIFREPTSQNIIQFEFNDDPKDVWPRTENVDYKGYFLMYSAFFADRKSAEQAVMVLNLKRSEDMQIQNFIAEDNEYPFVVLCPTKASAKLDKFLDTKHLQADRKVPLPNAKTKYYFSDHSTYNIVKKLIDGVFGANKLAEDAQYLGKGDDVIITGNVKFKGETGIIDSFGQDNRFVVVNLYNHGKHSFQSSDVELNHYAGSDEEESRMELDEAKHKLNTKVRIIKGHAKGKEGFIKEIHRRPYGGGPVQYVVDYMEPGNDFPRSVRVTSAEMRQVSDEPFDFDKWKASGKPPRKQPHLLMKETEGKRKGFGRSYHYSADEEQLWKSDIAEFWPGATVEFNGDFYTARLQNEFMVGGFNSTHGGSIEKPRGIKEENNDYNTRQKLIKFIARKKGWDASDLEHATTEELKQWKQECQNTSEDFDYDKFDAKIARMKKKVTAVRALLAKGKKPEPRLNPETGKTGLDYGDEDYKIEK